jgi:DNA protecting protein DprA
LLFVKGNMDLNARRIVGVVGTRRASRQGRARTAQFCLELAGYGCSIVSGLAYGIDAQAHQSAVEAGIPTGAVVAHGLDVLYPPSHHQLARNMLAQGGAIISDQLHGMKLSPEHFPKRNRIIAGLCDALLLVESMEDGGAMITADIAASYNRDVFAVPGRPDDPASAGCNLLIRQNRAALVCNAADMADMMGWTQQTTAAERQLPLFRQLNPEQQSIVSVLQQGNKSVDELFDERWNSDMANPKGLAFGLLSINFPGFAFDSFVEDEFTLVQAIERHTLELNSWPKTRIEFVEAFKCLVRTGEKFRGVRLSSFLLGDKAKSFQKHILERGDSNRE